MNTVGDIFDAFGGTSEIARVLDRNQSTASEMKRRASIPVQYWPALLSSEKGKALGLTADMLVEIHTQSARPFDVENRGAA